MQLQLASWPEIDHYLKSFNSIIIPIGSTEQHGPTGFIGTDALCPEMLASAVGDHTGALVAPTLPLGIAQHHMGFAGTITLQPSTLVALLRDTVNSLARHGFEKFYFLNGHGGNMATIAAGFSEIYGQSSVNGSGKNHGPIHCRQRNWWDGQRVRALSRKLFGKSEGSHATCSEISLTYFAYPDHMKTAELDPPVAPGGWFTDADDFRAKFPDGRMGSNPALANVEAGEQLYQAAFEDIIEDFTGFSAS